MKTAQQIIQAKPEKTIKLAIYSIGFFSLSLQTMMVLLIPLYALSLGASPFMIGLAVSAFSILPLLLAIKSGSMVDLVGSRKIICICALLMILFTFLHPLIPIIGVIIVLQLIVGQVQTMIWIAAQTHIAKIRKDYDDTNTVGIFSFSVNIGTFAGPLLTGYCWELYGPWGGFLLICFWALCLYISSLFLQEQSKGNKDDQTENIGDISKGGTFKKLLHLLAIPVVLMVVFGTFLRLAGFSMRGSFYLVYLEDISLSVMEITILYSLFSLVGSFSPLFIKIATRFVNEKNLLFVIAFLYLMPLVITPLFEGFWPLFILVVISGFFLGMTLPVLISLLSKSVSSEVQGLAVGLREMSNRFAAVFVPLLFGICVEKAGLEMSFYIVGAFLIGSILLIAPILRMIDHRHPQGIRK